LRPSDSGRAVTREAARLLYSGVCEEYKQAKEAASADLGLNAIPSNFDVAIELDLIADEAEGEVRRELLLKMRREALVLMAVLSEFDPRLIGSVWRGTARRGSDLDIIVYCSDSNLVKSKLSSAGYSLKSITDSITQEHSRLRSSKHIRVELNDDVEAEIVVRPPEDREIMERCDIYGDLKKGLKLKNLEKLMKTDPLRKFVPARKQR